MDSGVNIRIFCGLDRFRICFDNNRYFCVGRTMHVISLKLYVITPTRAQATNKRILEKDISYNATCFGALRHRNHGSIFVFSPDDGASDHRNISGCI
jgi:hypothetical protein